MCNNKQRRYCTCCGVKHYTENMREVYYRLLKKHAWHCLNCMSAMADNLHFHSGERDRYFIELFSGSKTISTVAGVEFGYSVFNVDIEDKYSPALCADIMQLRLNQIPNRNRVFCLWASLPCTFFTILNIADHWEKIVYSHRQYLYVPRSESARLAIKLLEKTIWLIKKINPVYFFIENPRGALRHMPQMNFAPYLYTVSYNDFGADCYKPTDIFTNCHFLKLPDIKTSVGRKFTGSVADQRNSFERSIVPPGLIREILKQVDAEHAGSVRISAGEDLQKNTPAEPDRGKRILINENNSG
jgi:hypothetical protein